MVKRIALFKAYNRLDWDTMHPKKVGKNTCKIQVLINTDRTVAFNPGMINLNLSPFNKGYQKPEVEGNAYGRKNVK